MRVYLSEVPHFPQTRDGTCLEACICMILAYLGSPVTEDTESLSLVAARAVTSCFCTSWLS